MPTTARKSAPRWLPVVLAAAGAALLVGVAATVVGIGPFAALTDPPVGLGCTFDNWVGRLDEVDGELRFTGSYAMTVVAEAPPQLKQVRVMWPSAQARDAAKAGPVTFAAASDRTAVGSPLTWHDAIVLCGWTGASGTR